MYEQGRQNWSGVYEINPDDIGGFEVFCNMTVDGGGWTVIQRRQDGSENFNRNWTEYEDGFGDMTGEFWLGLEKIRRITAARGHDVRIDLFSLTSSNYQDILKHLYIKYEDFKLGDHGQNYKLSVGEMSNISGKILVCLI